MLRRPEVVCVPSAAGAPGRPAEGACGTSLAWAARLVQPLLCLLHSRDSLLDAFFQSHSEGKTPPTPRVPKQSSRAGRQKVGARSRGTPPPLLARFTHAQRWGRSPEGAGGHEAISGTGQGDAGQVWSLGLVTPEKRRVPAPQPRPLLCEAGRDPPPPSGITVWIHPGS